MDTPQDPRPTGLTPATQSGRLLVAPGRLGLMLDRLAHQLFERHPGPGGLCIIGLQPRGGAPTRLIARRWQALAGCDCPVGLLDITFHRDDYRRRPDGLHPAPTHIPFSIEGQRVVLVDDVLYTGRSVRAALDALTAFGRPSAVELLVLVDRRYARELPIEAQYRGLAIDTRADERVRLHWYEGPDTAPDDGLEPGPGAVYLTGPSADSSPASIPQVPTA